MYQRPASTLSTFAEANVRQVDIFQADGTDVCSEKFVGCSIDQYYTKPEIVSICLRELGRLSEFDCVIEPSAGDGAFFSKIKHSKLIGLDITPHHPAIKKANWLTYKIDSAYKKVMVVGNPPFGRFNNLSAAFIQHALKFPAVSRIGFILPDVYNKHTRQAILPSHWRIKTNHKLPRNAFLYEGETRHVPCSFFVFCRSRGKDLRVPTKLPNIADFSFSNCKDYDVFIFGAAPKNILRQGEVKKNNRGHFLKSHIDVNRLIANLNAVVWQGNSCASGGVYWLTKNELAMQYYHRHTIEPKP